MRPCGTSLFQAGGAHVQKLKLKLKLGSAGDDHDVSPFRRYNEAMRMHIEWILISTSYVLLIYYNFNFYHSIKIK